jgi:CheY-like chemotaxis protein
MSIKILLADDSITIQKVVGIIFGGEEYALTVVDNGKAAVEKAREMDPDVLLIDALMPGMSGYEVCEAIRATPALAAKPILLLTGSFEPFDENKAKSCGADDFLAKPFESQQIINKVKELFELGSSRTGAAPAGAATPAPIEFDMEPATAQEAAPAAAGDIWGAFTAPEEDSTVAFDDTAFEVGTDQAETSTPAAEQKASDETGSQWIPVEEETFEFQEESTAKPAAPSFEESELSDSSAFEMEIPAPPKEAPASAPEIDLAPAFEEPAKTVAAPLATPAVAASLPPMSEDQLRAAIAGASKEVIERIVWEVVPDLAEIMIKEAIRKIKEGM